MRRELLDRRVVDPGQEGSGIFECIKVLYNPVGGAQASPTCPAKFGALHTPASPAALSSNRICPGNRVRLVPRAMSLVALCAVMQLSALGALLGECDSQEFEQLLSR